MKLWIVLPTFNEEESLQPLLDGIASALHGTEVPYGVVVVDDGSTDATRSVAEAHSRRLPVHVVPHPRNRGLARAVETGLWWTLPRAGDDDIIATMDADNTHPPELLPRMLEEVRRGADLVIASRYAPGGREEGVPLVRRMLSYGIGVLLRLRFRLRGVRDYSCGYRAYRAGLLKAAVARYGPRLIESPGFTVMAELLVKLQPFDPRVVEIPLHLRYDRKAGPSKMRVVRTVWEYVKLLAARRSSWSVG